MRVYEWFLSSLSCNLCKRAYLASGGLLSCCLTKCLLQFATIWNRNYCFFNYSVLGTMHLFCETNFCHFLTMVISISTKYIFTFKFYLKKECYENKNLHRVSVESNLKKGGNELSANKHLVFPRILSSKLSIWFQHKI